VVRHDEQGDAGSDVRVKQIEQPIDFAFEARAHVVNRCQEEALWAGRHSAPVRRIDGFRQSMNKASLEVHGPTTASKGRCGLSIFAPFIRLRAEAFVPM
jgi:hypothetical protein